MNLAQEMAAVIKRISDASGVIATYYGTQPEGFKYPSVYFPVPDVEQSFDTLSQFQLYFTFYVQFLARTAEDADECARKAQLSIARDQNCIEMFDVDGNPCGKYLNIADMFSRKISDEPGIVQLTISFVHREVVNGASEHGEVKEIVLDMTLKDAFDEASHMVSRFRIDANDERSK